MRATMRVKLSACFAFVGLLCVVGATMSQVREAIVRKDLLPNTNTSLPAAADSALRCSMSGLNAMGSSLLHAPIRSARGSKEMEALLVGLQASMYSELGMVDRAEALYGTHQAELLRLPYAPYGACLRAHLALHHHRMGRREAAFNLITAAVRPLADKDQCRAVAMGRYHLGVLMCWEGNDNEAVEHFGSAAHTIEEGNGNDADAACYWAAYAETLARLGRIEEADRAWRRAYTHALVDPVSRRRFARQIAIQHADQLLCTGESARAADCLRAYTPAPRGHADVLLTGMQEFVEARLALEKQDERSARHHLRAALWSLHRALTDEGLPLTRREGLLLRDQARRAVDLTFSTLQRDTLRQPELERAAWDTHLAELAFRLPTLQRGDGAVAMANLSWLEDRTEWERRSFDPDLRPKKREPWTPASDLRAFASQLPDGSRGIVIRRFVNVRGDRAPCYAAISVAPKQSVFPRMLWLDGDGVLENEIVPAFAKTKLGRGKAAKGETRSSEKLWDAVGAVLAAEVDPGGVLYLIPDGVFAQFDPSILFDPERKRYLGEAIGVNVLMSVPTPSKAAAVRQLRMMTQPPELRHDSLHCEVPSFLPDVSGTRSAGFEGEAVEDAVIFITHCDLEIGEGFPVRSSRELFTAMADAGAPGIIHPLWPVEESLTREFAGYMEAELQRSTDLSAGFHSARARMKTAHPDPRHWGAYRLVLTRLGE